MIAVPRRHLQARALCRWCCLAASLVTAPAATAAPAPAAAVPIATAASKEPVQSLEDQPLRMESPAGGDTGAATAAPNSDVSNPLNVGRVALALAAVLGSIFLLKTLGRRMMNPAGGRAGGGGLVRVLSRTAVAPRQQVLLLHVGRRVVVVGDSAGRLAPLCEISEPDEVAALVGRSAAPADRDAEPRFNSIFRRAKEPFDAEPDSAGPTHALPSDSSDEASDVVPPNEADSQCISGLLDKVRLMQNQFKRAT